MSKKIFIFLIFLSFIFQLLLSFYETHGDTHGYFIPWSESLEQKGTVGFYQRLISPDTNPNYPPLIVSVLAGFHLMAINLVQPIKDGLWALNTSIPFFPSSLVTFFYKSNLILYSFMKLPNILANIALAIGIYYLTKEVLKNKVKSKVPFLTFVSTLFNPALIYISALWGQVDVFPFVFVVWSFYLASRKSYNWSVFLMALALLTKQTVVLALPFYAVYLFDAFSPRRIAKWMTISYLTFVALFFPFQKTILDKLFPFMTYLKMVGSFASDKVSVHAHNFWQILYPNMRDKEVRLLSQLIVFGFMTYIIMRIWKKRNDLRYILSGFGLFSMYSFMFMTRMHERHLLVAIPFMLLSVLLDFKLYWIFVFESIYLLLNMYAAWPVPYMEFLAKGINNQPVVNVVIIIQLVVLAYTIYLFHKDTRPNTGKGRI